MVSAGTVSNDLNSVTTSLTSYKSSIDGLSSSWKGPSYDNLNAKAEEFLSEYKSVIEKQMSAFAAACTAYEQYIQEKNAYNTALANYNNAVASNSGNADSFLSEANTHKANMERLKQEIENNLSQASSPTLTAKAIGAEEAKKEAEAVTTSSTSSGAVIDNVIAKAMEIANDDTHGYSQKTRWGNPNYDCSSFVITCWDSAGTGVKAAGATYTGNMRNAFVKTGLFEAIPANKVTELKPGDVLLNENSHTEMYIGDGKMVGAHGDKDGRNGDSGGKEINVTKYHSGWEWVLRYKGPAETAVSV